MSTGMIDTYSVSDIRFFWYIIYTENRHSELHLWIKALQIVINYTLRKMYPTVELSEKGKKIINTSLYWTIFSFIMEQWKNTVLLLPCSSENASWVKTYFWILKIKIWKCYNSLHGSSPCPLNKNSLWTAKKFSDDYCSLKK